MKTKRLQAHDPRILKKFCKNILENSSEIITTETIIENQLKSEINSKQIEIIFSYDKFSESIKRKNLNYLSESEKEILKFAMELFDGEIIKITKVSSKKNSKKNENNFSLGTEKKSSILSENSEKLSRRLTVPLNKKCVVCGQTKWKIHNPYSKISTIQCQNCSHVELLFSSKPQDS